MQRSMKQKVSALFREFFPYFITLYAGIGMGLLVTIVCEIPLGFLKILDGSLARFLTGIIPALILLFIRSWRKGYQSNSATHRFKFRNVCLLIGMTFGVQILLSLLIAPTVYISGPAAWLSDYFSSSLLTSGEYPIALHDWLLMLSSDVFLYAPTMMIGEYLGAKKHENEFKTKEDIVC